MREMPESEFRLHWGDAVEEILENHLPLRFKRTGGQDIVVVSAKDWEQEQETLYVLQNKSLMEQIEVSMRSHKRGVGRDKTLPER